MRVSDAATDVGAEAQRRAGPWVERLARLGYAAKGVLYLLIGVLAVLAAIGWGGQVGDSRSALATLEGYGRLGTALLWIIAFGLGGYALWNVFRAALDPEGEGRDAKGIITRLFFTISAFIHATLALWLFTHLASGSNSRSDGTEDRVAQLLEWGLAGQLMVAVVGAGVVGFGVHQLVKAWRVDLSDQLELSRMNQGTRTATIWTGRLGLAARGIIFLVIGWFLLQAAWYSTSGRAGGLGDALHSVGSYGPVLLAVVAAGLAAYGLFMFIKARYRRIETR